MTHRSYRNDFLNDYYCLECGAEWPCLPHRQQTACLCRHSQSTHGQGGVGQCWSAACGCARFRLRVTE